MVEPIVVVGGGGFGREVMDVIDAINFHASRSEAAAAAFEVVGVVADPEPDLTLLEPYGVRYLGGVSRLAELPSDVGYVIGIGNGAARAAIDADQRRRFCPVLVHPSVTMGRATRLGPGTVVCAGVRLTNHVTTGRHVHLNLNVTVGHDAVLGDYVTVSPLAAISGNVTLGDQVTVGTGAALREKLTVAAGSTIGAGAAVVRNVAAGVTVVGVPARPLG